MQTSSVRIAEQDVRVLFVAPVTIGAGETITAFHMAEEITRCGGVVHFLASPFATHFLESHYSGCTTPFLPDGKENLKLWDRVINTFAPTLIIFADYPLLYFSNGVSPIEPKKALLERLQASSIRLATLDHTGFAQRAQGIFFSPPHLSFHYERWPAPPDEMALLLPCPMNEPSYIEGRIGTPYRYWNLPLGIAPETRQRIRSEYLTQPDDLLIFHAAAKWAWESARSWGLPYYEFLPEILTHYLKDLPRAVTVVSVNNGSLLRPPEESPIRFINLSSMPTEQYEALLFSSDLMITENRVSISLGKAICGGIPCMALRNSFSLRQLLEQMQGELRGMVKQIEARRPGAIYPYEMFPGGTAEWLDQLKLYTNNSITRAFVTLELFGEEQTRTEFHALLQNSERREALASEQAAYVSRLQTLPSTWEAVTSLL